MAPEKTKSSKILDNLHLFCQIQRKCLCFAEGVWENTRSYGLRIFVIKLSLPLFLFFILFFKIALSLQPLRLYQRVKKWLWR
jgi:hypothetical protein